MSNTGPPHEEQHYIGAPAVRAGPAVMLSRKAVHCEVYKQRWTSHRSGGCEFEAQGAGMVEFWFLVRALWFTGGHLSTVSSHRKGQRGSLGSPTHKP